jgi:hypothetical protein
MTTPINTILKAALELLRNNSSVASAVLSEFSNDDSTQTLHINLWRGKTLDDVLLERDLNMLEVVTEGSWEGGRCYSVQRL